MVVEKEIIVEKPVTKEVIREVTKEKPVAIGASTYADRGSDYSDNENYDQAIEAYDNAIRLDPDNAEYYNSRAWNYALMGEYPESLTDANKSLNLEPGIPHVLDTRGWALVGLGEYHLAIQDFNKAIEIKAKPLTPKFTRPSPITSKVPYLFDHRGAAYYRFGHYQDAIEDFSKAIYMDPLSAMAYYDRSLTYPAIGNGASAENDIKQGCLLIRQKAQHNEFYEDGRDFNCNRADGGGWTALANPRRTETFQSTPDKTVAPTRPPNPPPTLKPTLTPVPPSFITLGSTKAEVRAIQGTPTLMAWGPSGDSMYDYWYYGQSKRYWDGRGLSRIDFDGNGRVQGWSADAGVLKLK